MPSLSVSQRVVLWNQAFTEIRRHFCCTGVQEVSTAIRVAHPAIEADIDVLAADGQFLATSPELAMKELLAHGSGPIFQIAHAFRKEAVDHLHREEFHLLEWYRLDESLDTVLNDVEAVVKACFKAAGAAGPTHWLRTSLLDLIEDTLGLALEGQESAVGLRRKLGEDASVYLAGAPEGVDPDDAGLTLGTWNAFLANWSQRHFVPWLRQKPHTGVHLCDFPAVMSAMAATSDTAWGSAPARGRRFAHRFESFVAGIECANGYRELRDSQVQRSRLENANRLRAWRGLPVLPLPESFLAALEHPGLPPCAGVAMGLDRLLMTAAGGTSIQDSSTFLMTPSYPSSIRRRSLRTTAQLAAAGLLDPASVAALEPVTHKFQVALSPTMHDVIVHEGPEGPLRRQFVPTLQELEVAPEESVDPIGDTRFSPVQGLVHRYPDRVLLLPTLLCSVYCRFCFRREQVGDPERGVLTPERVEPALHYIRQHPMIAEVILTGGDPLILSTHRLQSLVTQVAAIPHVRVLRIHTRVPLVEPARITAALVAALRSRLALYIVLHTNHPSEFTDAGIAALAQLANAGIPLLSQSVLLKGTNNDVDTLVGLFRILVHNRVKPYYLHHPDLAKGTGHFRVSLEEGRALMRALRGRLSGLCQPTYVLDIPGGHGKVPVGPTFLHGSGAVYQIDDPWGGVHSYKDLGAEFLAPKV